MTKAVTESLAPDKYHWRAPFFAHSMPGALEFPKLTQDEMDLEIEQAAYAGIDYWAFVAYGPQNPMSRALDNYLSSRLRAKVKFCLFANLTNWGIKQSPSADISKHLDLMQTDSYVRVMGGRPLYFLGFIDDAKIQARWGTVQALRNQIANFRTQARARGLYDPYIVLGANPSSINSLARQLGGDAVGAYAFFDQVANGSYADLSTIAWNGWRKLAESGLPVVPTVMAGWDRRPRVEHPVPWEPSQKPLVGMENYFQAGTPQEIAQQVSAALAWISAQPLEHQAPAILIYAWNENDEGGWLIPTGACDHSRLKALHDARVINQSEPEPFCGRY
ncbi:MAG: hypothetical protein P4L81_02850 [Candidatus Pacebacteria bacterium]|nr:hypothetical protein [Candidatus Paceibacterota bacterium]